MCIRHRVGLAHRAQKLHIVQIIAERHALRGCDVQIIAHNAYGHALAQPQAHQIHPVRAGERHLQLIVKHLPIVRQHVGFRRIFAEKRHLAHRLLLHGFKQIRHLFAPRVIHRHVLHEHRIVVLVGCAVPHGRDCVHIRQTARQLHSRAHQLLRHGLERHDFASVAHHAAVFADVHQLVRDLAELLVQVVILPSGCRCEAYTNLFQCAHQRKKALGQLLAAGQQRAVHICGDQFDRHGSPFLSGGLLRLERMFFLDKHDCKDQTQRDTGQQQRFFANSRGRQCANRTAEDEKQDD